MGPRLNRAPVAYVYHMKKLNWLIEAIRIGYERGDEGISFNELNAELTRLGRRQLSANELYAMRYWFHSNFVTCWYGVLNGSPDRGTDFNLMHTDSNDEKGMLDHKGVMNYLTYLNYEQALNSSKAAQTIAIVAIVISSGLALTQILLQVCTSGS